MVGSYSEATGIRFVPPHFTSDRGPFCSQLPSARPTVEPSLTNCCPMANFILPRPSARGIAKAQALMQEAYGRELTEREAMELLERMMRFLYLMNNPTSDPEKAAELAKPENRSSDLAITQEENARRWEEAPEIHSISL
jgi:hypothetical protein